MVSYALSPNHHEPWPLGRYPFTYTLFPFAPFPRPIMSLCYSDATRLLVYPISARIRDLITTQSTLVSDVLYSLVPRTRLRDLIKLFFGLTLPS